MLSDSEKKVVKSYMEKLFQVIRERKALDRKIQDLETSIRSILALHEEEDVIPYLDSLYELLPPEGFTDAIRKVLRSSEEALTPAEVKENLPEIGFSLEGYSNPLASIHTILKRLAGTESVDQEMKDGKTAYKWKVYEYPPAEPFNRLRTLRDLMGVTPKKK